ncbi:MAG: hypothetical protein US30_C0006G0042 [Candidatus Moranbacteria bacterium GW2011_GWF2_36_839]|nr:MAG: hypothetical protein US27_C0006G0049 [Candidatus Moranbacteria bacterium GW2011_GWF1_36_78]KKQ17153.1 MAG: hypothetical protein US30_C0006G0042 [Candidatus Moranbacteria bacterium GW2011_GWF2_36_839]
MNQNQIIKQLLNDRQVRIQATKKSHNLFFHVYLSEYVRYETADFQKEMFRITEDDSIRGSVIVAFRGSAKSTIMDLSYPLWAVMGKQQKKFVVIFTQTQQQAKLIMSNLRKEMETNKLLMQEMGPFEEQNGQWSSLSIVIPRFNARIMVASVDQSIRGMRHGAYRPDLIILDDVEDLDSVKTKEGRDKTFNWFAGEVIPAGDESTKIIIIGNLLHEDSLLMRLRESIEKGKWNGIFKSYPLVRVVDDESIILWPGKFKSMEDIKRLNFSIPNENSWQREYMLNIVPDEGQIILPEWIHHYNKLPAEQPNFVITGIDLAISEKDTADYTAMVSACAYGTGERQRVYILPNPVNRRMDFPKTLEKIKELNQFLSGIGCPKIYIEEVGYQGAIIQQLRTMGIFAEGVNPHGSDKRSRLVSVSGLIFSGKIMFPSHGAKELIQQLTGFGKEKHDDLADAFSILALQIIERARKQGGFIIAGAPLPDFM